MVMGLIFIVYLAVYLFAYDKSYYHVDTVREPFIRFLFMESMLLGAWFKLNDEKLRNKGKTLLYGIFVAISFVVYFAFKILFSKKPEMAQYQLVNQLMIFILLFFIMRWFSSMDGVLEKSPKWLSKGVHFLAKLTLEIYLVQYVLIDVIRGLNLFFPLNWVVLTASIILAAFALHTVIELGTKLLNMGVKKIKKTTQKANEEDMQGE